jgi:hypothetical protein
MFESFRYLNLNPLFQTVLIEVFFFYVQHNLYFKWKHQQHTTVQSAFV